MVNERPSTGSKHVHFPGMDPAEDFRFYYRRHWLALAQPTRDYFLWMVAFFALAIAAGVTGMEDDITRRATTIMLCILFIIPNIIFLTKIYKHFLYIVIVTDKKVHQFKRTLLAVDKHESIDLWMLQDVNKSQRGIVQNIFGFGTLFLEAQNSRIKLHWTPRIDHMYDIIVGLREEARRRSLPRRTDQRVQRFVEEEQEKLQREGVVQVAA